MATKVLAPIRQSKPEVRQWDFDFTDDLLGGVTISSATATHTPPSGAATTPSVGTISGAKVPVTFGPLTVLGEHFVDCLATLSNGEKSEIRLAVLVEWAPAVFTYDPSLLASTPLFRVRMHLGDKAWGQGPWPDGSNFADAEITELLTLEDNEVMRAAAAGLEALANAWAKVASLTAGSRREDFNHVSEMYAKRARALRMQYGGAANAFSVSFKRADGYADMGAFDPQVGTALSEYYRARQHVRRGW